MVNLQSTPVSNTLPVLIGIGNLIDTIPAGGAVVLTKSFNQIFINNPATAILNQVTPGVFNVMPGQLAIISNNAIGGVNFEYASPSGLATVVHFA